MRKFNKTNKTHKIGFIRKSIAAVIAAVMVTTTASSIAAPMVFADPASNAVVVSTMNTTAAETRIISCKDRVELFTLLYCAELSQFHSSHHLSNGYKKTA